MPTPDPRPPTHAVRARRTCSICGDEVTREGCGPCADVAELKRLHEIELQLWRRERKLRENAVWSWMLVSVVLSLTPALWLVGAWKWIFVVYLVFMVQAWRVERREGRERCQVKAQHAEVVAKIEGLERDLETSQ